MMHIISIIMLCLLAHSLLWLLTSLFVGLISEPTPLFDTPGGRPLFRSTPAPTPFSLTSSFPPIPTKLVAKIRSPQFVEQHRSRTLA